jgi:hypothetical protein
MSSKKGRRLILIRNDLLEDIIKITAREGKTVFAFTNEVFEQALKAYETQTSPAELLDFYTLMMLEKDRGAVLIPIDLLNHLLQKGYKIDKEDLLEKWYECGLWYGKYLSIKSQSENWLQIFEKLMKKCAWNISDFSITTQGENISIKCVSPYFTTESTEAFMKFLEGTMHSANYKTIKNECLKGMILLDFKKQE